MTIPTQRLQEVLRLAEEATPGPWNAEHGHYDDHGGRYDEINSPVEIIWGEWGGPSGANAAYIAAANPAFLKALISDYLAKTEALSQAEADLAGARGWRPIESAPKDGTIMLRPHTTWGAMAVRHKRPDQSEEFLQGFSWMSSDYSNLWPEQAFYPLWMPLPPAPSSNTEG